MLCIVTTVIKRIIHAYHIDASPITIRKGLTLAASQSYYYLIKRFL